MKTPLEVRDADTQGCGRIDEVVASRDRLDGSANSAAAMDRGTPRRVAMETPPVSPTRRTSRWSYVR